MNKPEERLTIIKEKVHQLVLENERLRSENRSLRHEIGIQNEVVDSQKNTIKELEDKNKITKIAEVISLGKEDSKDLKYKINEFIREIDKCIALLND